MNKILYIFKRLRKWYRSLFIENPEGYGDSISPEVDKFQIEMNQKNDTAAPVPDEIKPHHENPG